mmetsp:Transcript_27668/g.70541  ORF Transcript_27668/g.70541 Transcript_27668/m.70541 type:complete len:250 (-) Transcript_27668:169-918(-)
MGSAPSPCGSTGVPLLPSPAAAPPSAADGDGSTVSDSRCATNSAWPLFAAASKAHTPPRALFAGSTPYSSRTSTTLMWPASAARRIAVRPHERPAASMSAPAASSKRAASACPRLQASASGSTPRRSTMRQTGGEGEPTVTLGVNSSIVGVASVSLAACAAAAAAASAREVSGSRAVARLATSPEMLATRMRSASLRASLDDGAAALAVSSPKPTTSLNMSCTGPLMAFFAAKRWCSLPMRPMTLILIL